MVKKEAWSGYEKYTISNDEISVSVLNLGATVTAIDFAGANRALCHEEPELYLTRGGYIGATVGRYANRIGNSCFTLDGVKYELTPNEGPNQLHGGPGSWPFRVWDAEQLGDYSVRFSIASPDGENGFPGNMTASVTFTVRGSTLRFDFEGDTDMPTVYAPTTHTYFNLSGGKNVIESTKLKLNSSLYLEPGQGLIPTGLALPCIGDFDFTELRTIGIPFDHAFVLNGTEACVAEGDQVRLTVTTDFPAIQLYTGEFLEAPHGAFGGFALEPEFYPDCPNHPEWPSAVLRPGEHFRKYAEYCFEAV